MADPATEPLPAQWRPGAGRARPVRRAAGVLLLLAAFGYLFGSKVDWQELLVSLARFDPSYLALIVGAQLVFHLLGGLALWVLTLRERRLGFWELLRAYWRCLAIGYWTPAGVGEVSFSWFLRHSRVPAHETLALLTVDKVVTLAVTAVIALPALWLAAPSLAAWSDSVASLGLVAFGVVGVGVALYLLLSGRGVAARLRAWLASYARSTERMALRSPLLLAGNVLLTVGRLTLAGGVYWWSIAALGGPPALPFLEFLVLVHAARLLALLLPAPNGLGVFEVALVESMPAGAASAAAVVSGALVARGVALGVVLVGFVLPRIEPPVGESGGGDPG